MRKDCSSLLSVEVLSCDHSFRGSDCATKSVIVYFFLYVCSTVGRKKYQDRVSETSLDHLSLDLLY